MDTAKIDKLINLVGELVITQSMLSDLGSRFEIKQLPVLLERVAQLERNTREIQERVMGIRMLPIGTAFSRFPRLVRDLYTTPVGDYITFHKRPTRHMAAGDLASSGFDLPGVPWVIYIKENGTSFHGTYWHNDYGRPRSHGCINLTPQAAKWLYRWTNPTVPSNKEFVYGHVGTRVDIKE